MLGRLGQIRLPGLRRVPVVRRLHAVVVAGESMTPALRPGDCLLACSGGRLRVGDVALARRPSRGSAGQGHVDGLVPQLLLVKRVARRDDDGWWLLSDNAAAGLDDSRVFGAVPDADIVGRVVLRYYPWRRRGSRLRERR